MKKNKEGGKGGGEGLGKRDEGVIEFVPLEKERLLKRGGSLFLSGGLNRGFLVFCLVSFY